MNILVACNEKYIKLAKYMLFSVFKYNGKLRVYLIHENVSDVLLDELRSFFDVHGIGELNIIKFDSSKIELPLKDDKITGHITKEAYFRLYAPFYLPSTMDRILYLDCDIICRNNISDFYNTDFEEKIFVGCINSDLANNEYNSRLNLPEDHVYINSGVLLFNLKKYKEFVSVDLLNKFIADNADVLDFQDQDVVNKLFCGKILQSHVYNNFQVGMLLYTEGGNLVHYTGPVKPWFDEYSRPFLAKPYYDILEFLGEYELLEYKKKCHVSNFKMMRKLATIFVNGGVVTESQIINVINQLETRVEFVISYDTIDLSLVDKYTNLDCRVSFVPNDDLNDYYDKVSGIYFSYFNIDDFSYMDPNFIRELCYFIDNEFLSIVFFKDFQLHDGKKIVDFNSTLNSSEAIKLMEDNENNGYRSIYIFDFSLCDSNKYGYFED